MTTIPRQINSVVPLSPPPALDRDTKSTTAAAIGKALPLRLLHPGIQRLVAMAAAAVVALATMAADTALTFP